MWIQDSDILVFLLKLLWLYISAKKLHHINTEVYELITDIVIKKKCSNAKTLIKMATQNSFLPQNDLYTMKRKFNIVKNA